MAKQSVFVGEVYQSKKCGPFKVVSYTSANEVMVRFVNTGYEVMVHTGAIKKGQIKDKLIPSVEGVGIVGDGDFPLSYFCSEKGRMVKHPVYTLWTGMLTRCYNRKYQNRHTSYIGCEVAPEWRNYQDFFLTVRGVPGFDKWCDYQLGLSDDQYALDKDKLVEGNRLYSPSTCCFITVEENSLLAVKAKLEKFQ